MLARPSLLAGIAVLLTAAPSLHAQTNPFLPSSAASRNDVSRMIDDRLKALQDRLSAMEKNPKPSTTAPGAGAGTAPGMIPGGAQGAGPLSPGGIAPYGAPGGPEAMIAAPVDPIEEARSSNVRFLGCINGAPKFVKESGERVVFTAQQVSRAVKAGILPACR